MIRDLAFVLALPSDEESKALGRQLMHNLTPMGQRRVHIALAPCEGAAFLESLRTSGMEWWNANVFDDEGAFICVAHEEGISEWAAAVPETNLLIWIRGPEEIEPYKDAPRAQALLAASVLEFGALVMARTPSLEPGNELEAPFAGIVPAADEVLLEPVPAQVGAVVDWTGADSEDQEEGWDDHLGGDGAAGAPVEEAVAATGPMANASNPVDDRLDEPLAVEIPDVEEPLVPPELGVAVEASTVAEPDEDIPETESRAVASAPAAPQVAEAISHEPSDIYDDIAAKLGLEATPDPSADLPEAPPVPRSAEFAPPVASEMRDVEDAESTGLSGGIASTPHPYVLYADYLARRAARAAPAPALQPVQRQGEPVKRTTGPVALPPPVQAVWDDLEPKPAPLPSPTTSRPAPRLEPEAELVDPLEDLVPDLADFDIDGVSAPSPFGDDDFLFGPVPTLRVATAPPRAQPARQASASTPYRAPERMPTAFDPGTPDDMPPMAPSTVHRAPVAEPDKGSSPGIIERLRMNGGKSPFGAAGRLLSGSGGKPRPPKAQYTDSELAGFLDRRRGIVICVGALKGGVGKTAVASGLADWAGKILSPSNAAAAYVDANLNNPDAAGFFRQEVGRNMVSVRTVVAALANNEIPPEPIKALTDSVALYPERPGAAEYQEAEIQRFADYLRVQYRVTIVDLANVFPSMDGGPAAAAALYWLAVADVVVVPSDVNPTSSLPDAYQYIEGLAAEFGLPEEPTGKPVFVPYIVPNDSAVYSNAEVKKALAAVAGQGAALYPIPYNPRVMVAGATHQSLTSVSKPLSAAYRALLEGTIVAFTNRDREF